MTMGLEPRLLPPEPGWRHVLRRVLHFLRKPVVLRALLVTLVLAMAIPVAVFIMPSLIPGFIGFDTTGTTGTTDATDTSTTTLHGERNLYLNGWIESPNLARPKPLESVATNNVYTFTVDLSAWRAASHFPGAGSFPPGPELARAIADAPREQLVLNAYVRPVLLGRGLRLLGDDLKVDVWRGGVWEPLDSSDELVPFDVDLERLRRSDEITSDEPEDLRFAGIRFDVETIEAGCAAVALSIWSANKRMPLDNIVFPVTIGDVDCSLPESESSRRAEGLTRLLYERPDLTFDGALHVFEYRVRNRAPGAVAVYVPASPDGTCGHYQWEPSQSVSAILTERAFLTALDNARTRKGYPELAKLLQRQLFPANADAPCGAAAAFAHLSRLASKSPPKLFIRLIDTGNEPYFLPIGVLFLVKSDAGERLFRNAPVIVTPLPRETYRSEGCISDLTFAIPSKLHDNIETFAVAPADHVQPIHSIAELDAFMSRASESPLAFVLLAHQGDGTVYFEDPKNPWSVGLFGRTFAPGSVAVLGTCNAGSLRQQETRLVRKLNENGIDAMILSSFDMRPAIGIALAKNMTEELVAARRQPSAVTIVDVYAAARRGMPSDLKKAIAVDEETAEGYLSEFSLAGNGGIRICAKEN